VKSSAKMVEAIQEYLFDNQTDFLSGHYINLMNLVKIAYNEKKIPKYYPFIRGADIMNDRYRPGYILQVTPEEWIEHFSETLDSEQDFKQAIINYTSRPASSGRIVFPYIISSNRHKIHKMNRHRVIESISLGNSENNRTLSIYFSPAFFN